MSLASPHTPKSSSSNSKRAPLRGVVINDDSPLTGEESPHSSTHSNSPVDLIEPTTILTDDPPPLSASLIVHTSSLNIQQPRLASSWDFNSRSFNSSLGSPNNNNNSNNNNNTNIGNHLSPSNSINNKNNISVTKSNPNISPQRTLNSDINGDGDDQFITSDSMIPTPLRKRSSSTQSNSSFGSNSTPKQGSSHKLMLDLVEDIALHKIQRKHSLNQNQSHSLSMDHDGFYNTNSSSPNILRNSYNSLLPRNQSAKMGQVVSLLGDPPNVEDEGLSHSRIFHQSSKFYRVSSINSINSSRDFDNSSPNGMLLMNSSNNLSSHSLHPNSSSSNSNSLLNLLPNTNTTITPQSSSTTILNHQNIQSNNQSSLSTKAVSSPSLIHNQQQQQQHQANLIHSNSMNNNNNMSNSNNSIITPSQISNISCNNTGNSIEKKSLNNLLANNISDTLNSSTEHYGSKEEHDTTITNNGNNINGNSTIDDSNSVMTNYNSSFISNATAHTNATITPLNNTNGNNTIAASTTTITTTPVTTFRYNSNNSLMDHLHKHDHSSGSLELPQNYLRGVSTLEQDSQSNLKKKNASSKSILKSCSSFLSEMNEEKSITTCRDDPIFDRAVGFKNLVQIYESQTLYQGRSKKWFRYQFWLSSIIAHSIFISLFTCLFFIFIGLFIVGMTVNVSCTRNYMKYIILSDAINCLLFSLFFILFMSFKCFKKKRLLKKYPNKVKSFKKERTYRFEHQDSISLFKKKQLFKQKLHDNTTTTVIENGFTVRFEPLRDDEVLYYNELLNYSPNLRSNSSLNIQSQQSLQQMVIVDDNNNNNNINNNNTIGNTVNNNNNNGNNINSNSNSMNTFNNSNINANTNVNGSINTININGSNNYFQSNTTTTTINNLNNLNTNDRSNNQPNMNGQSSQQYYVSSFSKQNPTQDETSPNYLLYISVLLWIGLHIWGLISIVSVIDVGDCVNGLGLIFFIPNLLYFLFIVAFICIQIILLVLNILK